MMMRSKALQGCGFVRSVFIAVQFPLVLQRAHLALHKNKNMVNAVVSVCALGFGSFLTMYMVINVALFTLAPPQVHSSSH